ncbi:cellulose-binding domain-containing protein [Amycolatopsis mongoliensis]|uniref:Cellulose-binding domain-containing protein n=1 Tax=Amycolatopsis mongoliensis TaxID=715475 RepID=A0A9Y2NGX3_9PSEU|nr:cellulose-binding domain-containing protein [Amycolatopsis sp. 4-36]WIY01274.1 cellulose-binding domain-containing protein [Amycolatopsis sp. 4-36]
MARADRRQDDEISVAELLRETGATPRSLGGPPEATPAREEDTGDGYRERLEQRAREAAADQQRAGRRIRWVSAVAGAVVVVGSLVLIAVTSESSPGRQAALGPGPLAPATTTPRPTTPIPVKPTPTPIPTVLRQTATSPAESKPQPPPAPVETAPCVVRFSVTDQWNDGFTAGVAITNKSSATLSPWTLSWTFTAGQRVTHGWDGKYSQSGSRVTVNAESYNATLAPGATVSTGLNGAFDHGNPAPTAFTLNGARCDAG